MKFSEIEKRIYSINKTLVAQGMSWEDIRRFWNECLNEVNEKAKNAKKKDHGSTQV